MENYEVLSLFNNSGGVQQNVSRLLVAENECAKIENGELDKIGHISKVKGYTQRGTDVNTDYNILGGGGFYKNDGTQKQIVFADGASNSDAYTYNPATNVWSPHSLSLSTGAKVELEPFLDGFFMVNFDDATRFNNFTQWYTTTNVTDAPKAKYIKQYNSRLYLAYCVDGGTTYPSRVIYSDLPTGTPFTIAWNNAENYFDNDIDDGDVIKGLGVNGGLLVFKENSLFLYDTNSRYKIPGCPGTVSNRSIKNILGWTLFLHTSGIWAYAPGSTKLLTRNIQELIDGISTKNLTNACAFVDGDHYYLYVGDVNNSTTGFTVDKCLIDIDMAKSACVWQSLQHEPLVFFEYRDNRSGITYDSATVTYNSAETTYDGLLSVSERIYFGTTDGKVYERNRGQTFGTYPIDFEFQSHDIYFRSPSNWKELYKIGVNTKNGRGLTIQYKCDDGDWRTLGRTSKDQEMFSFPSGTRCQRVAIRVTESSSGDRFTVEGFEIFYRTGGLVE